jgi:photosystem II stability/assembly factor-like uncharacterized protein
MMIAAPKSGKWLISVALLFMLLFARNARAERPGGFRILGPGGGGATFNPTISPHDPKTVLVSCDMRGNFITHDGGQTWRMFNLRGGLNGFVFDPTNDGVIYALGIGLWRSRDNGDTWQLVAPRPSKVYAVANPSDEGEGTILSTDSMVTSNGSIGEPTAMVIDPADAKKLYVTFGTHLWHSKDGGDHWSQDDDLPNRVEHLALARKGSSGSVQVWMAGRDGFWLSKGVRPQAFLGPQGRSGLHDESIDVVNGKVILLAAQDGVLYVATVDAGESPKELTWKPIKELGEGALFDNAVSGHDGTTLYASFRDLKSGDKDLVGIAKSEDLGEHWKLVLSDDGRGTANLSDGWMGSVWHDPPLAMVVSEKDHALVYATEPGRTMKSTDGGAHWQSLYSRKGSDGGAVSSGLDVLTNYGVFFDPFDSQRMFIAYTDVGLMRSENRGESWWRSTDGVPEGWTNTTYWMVFDPAVKGRVWAVMSDTHDLPRPRMWRNRMVETFAGGVCMSDDGGKHWTVQNDGLPEAAATHILLDPKSAPEARTLYVATMGHGVFKSVDGGAHWSAKNNGVFGHEPMAWRMALATDGTLYMVTARMSDNGAVGDSRDGVLYRSRDGAETWERMTLPEGVNGPNGIAIDPRDPLHIYVSAWPRNKARNGVDGGIFATTDGGAHWTLIFNYRQHIYDVTMNPKNPDELFATGFDSGAFRSTDGGVHWQRIAGYNFESGHRVIPDPMNPGMVYIATFGGGVWYGHVGAEPGVEDITTKEVVP